MSNDLSEYVTQCRDCAAPVYDAVDVNGNRKLFEPRGHSANYLNVSGGDITREVIWTHVPHRCNWRDQKRMQEFRAQQNAVEIRTTYPNALVYDESVFKPYSVTCPTCGEGKNVKCRNLTSTKAMKRKLTAHKERNFAAINAAGLKVIRKGTTAFLVPKTTTKKGARK